MKDTGTNGHDAIVRFDDLPEPAIDLVAAFRVDLRVLIPAVVHIAQAVPPKGPGTYNIIVDSGKTTIRTTWGRYVATASIEAECLHPGEFTFPASVLAAMRHLGAEDRLVVEVSRVAGVDTPVRCRARFATSAGVGGEELTSKTPGVWPAGLDAPPHLTTTELIHALKARALLGSTVPPRFVNGLMRAMKTATAVRAVQASGWTYVEVDGFGVGWQAKENRAQRKQGTQLIAISRIRRDPELQVRAATDKMTVFSYAELLKQEDEFPPVTVFDDGEVLWLADGNHTLLAHKLAGKSMVRADVRRGTRRDALDHACRANGRHGLPLSAADDPEPGSAAEWEYDWELYDQLKPDHPESPIDLAIEARSVQRALGIPY